MTYVMCFLWGTDKLIECSCLAYVFPVRYGQTYRVEMTRNVFPVGYGQTYRVELTYVMCFL
jgi:hypothetical protein